MLHSKKGHLLKYLELPVRLRDFCSGDPAAIYGKDLKEHFDNSMEAYERCNSDYCLAFPQRRSPNSLTTWKYAVPKGYEYPDHLERRAKSAFDALSTLRGRPIAISLLPDWDPLTVNQAVVMTAS